MLLLRELLSLLLRRFHLTLVLSPGLRPRPLAGRSLRPGIGAHVWRAVGVHCAQVAVLVFSRALQWRRVVRACTLLLGGTGGQQAVGVRLLLLLLWLLLGVVGALRLAGLLLQLRRLLRWSGARN